MRDVNYKGKSLTMTGLPIRALQRDTYIPFLASCELCVIGESVSLSSEKPVTDLLNSAVAF